MFSLLCGSWKKKSCLNLEKCSLGSGESGSHALEGAAWRAAKPGEEALMPCSLVKWPQLARMCSMLPEYPKKQKRWAASFKIIEELEMLLTPYTRVKCTAPHRNALSKTWFKKWTNLRERELHLNSPVPVNFKNNKSEVLKNTTPETRVGKQFSE